MRTPQSHRLRNYRVSESNRIYLLTTASYKREPLFSDIDLGRVVARSMQHHHRYGYVDSIAFVVMPDHLHWLVKLSPGITPSRLMHSLKSATSREINSRCDTTGRRVWQPGFREYALRHNKEVLDTARHIVNNPLRAGLVRHLGEYPLWDALWLEQVAGKNATVPSAMWGNTLMCAWFAGQDICSNLTALFATI